MNIQINNYIKRINELHNQLGVQLRTPISTAIEIGKLLIEVKNNLEHGEFLNWINDNCKFSNDTANNYMKLFTKNEQIGFCNTLQEAYKQIETLEKQEKQTESQRKNQMINQYIETGIKPDGWDRSLDYEYNKRKKEDEERNKRIEETKNKMQNESERKENEYKIFDEVNELLSDIKETENKKAELKKQIGMTVNDESKFIDALQEYLFTLDSDNIRLNVLHNIIKFCKNKINEYQRKSLDN